ncbi:uncharacterized protein LOC135480758 [Liolophura sinensis]|uniref:uncharacterized protein LOC135480758 n=1 Tax=Liolophura sinensis TaxID=3198878 RepID=UPI003158DF58
MAVTLSHCKLHSKENTMPTTTTGTSQNDSSTSVNKVSNGSAESGFHKSLSATSDPMERFKYETKYVVLGFMKNLPKDVNQRTWTPVSSTPSSETGDIFVAKGPRKNYKALPKKRKHKHMCHFESQITKHERECKTDSELVHNDYDEYCGTVFPHSSKAKDKFIAQMGVHGKEGLSERKNHQKENTEDQNLLSSNVHQGINNPSSSHPIQDNDISESGSSRDIFNRSISVGSSKGDGSSITDADDEMESNSSHSSQRLHGMASGTNSDTAMFDEDIVVDGLPEESSTDSLEIPGYPIECKLMNDEHAGGEVRKMTLSSSNTIVPGSCENGDSPVSLGDEDPFKDQSPKSLRRADLHLNLDSHGIFRPESNITESFQEVIEESSSQLESEVNDAIAQGKLTPTQLGTAANLGSLETKVAQLLVTIADRVEAQYGHQLEMAVQTAFRVDLREIPYEQFSNAVTGVIDESLNGWAQVALCLLYSQHLTLAAIQSGQRRVGYLFDYTARLVADKAAHFIINQGGWSSLAQVDIDSSVSPLSLSQGSGESSRVPSPCKFQPLQIKSGPPSPGPLPEEGPTDHHSSSEESTSSLSEQTSHDNSHTWSTYCALTLIRRAHYFGLSFSVVAAFAVVGIAVLLSKH